MRANPEHQAQATYFSILAVNERRIPMLKWVFAVPNGGHRNKATAGRLRAEGVKSGVSDIFIPIPANGYNGCWMELKIKPNRVSEAQQEFLNAMEAHGYRTTVAWSCDELLDMTESYLGVKLNR